MRCCGSSEAGHSSVFHSNFFGTQEGKTFSQCEISMKLGVDRQHCWNSNEDGFPLEWMTIKMKYDSSWRAINHPCVGGALGSVKVVGVAVKLEKSVRGGEGALSKMQRGE
ncbi:hypothetical protein AVEN_90745-1 [Araneus ventricosus]|uniref:Uncharacterized protein n=1 Tax=Araneus ventricosus TaxID=182803 RepID=A0A4Y2UPU0_ARAVE|nr:hypothetical protein AVEN_90745-1 [Araneus ventricosus]